MPGRIDGPCWIQATNTKNGWVSKPYILLAGYYLPTEGGNIVYRVVEPATAGLVPMWAH